MAPRRHQPETNKGVRKITEFFPVRRSSRRPTSQLQSEVAERTRQLIETGYNEDFLRVYVCDVKGRGIRAGRPFRKDEFVVEYRGEIVTGAEAKEREREYDLNPSVGSYMYFFAHRNRRFCVDATHESPYKGRLVNHSYLKPNLKSKVVEVEGEPRLCLFAARDIEIGEELLYDYGDRRKNTIESNPWLKHS